MIERNPDVTVATGMLSVSEAARVQTRRDTSSWFGVFVHWRSLNLDYLRVLKAAEGSEELNVPLKECYTDGVQMLSPSSDGGSLYSLLRKIMTHGGAEQVSAAGF